MSNLLDHQKTFKFVCSSNNVLVDSPRFDFGFASSGEYCVDDSHFVPMSEAVKQLGIGSSISVEPLYDFNDGKDNGMKLAAARKKGSTLAEISNEILEANNSISEAIKNQQTFETKVASFEKGLENPSGSGEA